MHPALTPFLAIALGLAASLPAQDVRELSVPAGNYTLVGVSTTTITNQINAGYRLVDIEYRGVSGLGAALYEAAFVENAGVYAEGWWWYTGITAAQVGSYLSTNQARLIDLEPYEDAGGNLRFACIMVDNTGANNKATWWVYNTTTSGVSTVVSANSARIVDLDSYVYNGTTYYSAVMISNTGVDARAWWWSLNVTTAQVSAALTANSARLYDLEKRSNGNWDCVMIQDVTPVAWHWWPELTLSDIGYLLGQYGVRTIDIESFLVGGSRRYSMVTINNSNALTTNVGAAMRARTDGQVGCWFERINGSNIARLNSETQFEPASTMKTLHHVHAMRRVMLGAVSLSSFLNVYLNYQNNTSCPIDTGGALQNLQGVLQAMMEQSDNARTQAVAAYFGVANINNTAAALSMTGTSLNHRIGCPEAITNPNRITLKDLHTLHEQVANGYLGAERDTFYALMQDSVSDLGVAALINAEGASLGLPSATITSFRNFTRMASKGGSYGWSTGGPFWYDRAEFAWLSLPWIQNDVITPREYTFGAFVNQADVDQQAADAIYVDAIPEMLRPTIRAALQSWSNSLAGIQSFGSGCGSPFTYSQSVVGLPRIGTTVTYRGNAGFANSLAILGVGFSSTVANGNPLPLLLTPLGSDPGCYATNDILINEVVIAGPTGIASFPVVLPYTTGFVGIEYLTQCWSFGSSSFRTSNSYRSIVGL